MNYRRLRARVRGVVQGVGFRPHVYRLARELRLAGVVGNDALGVFLEVEGPLQQLELFFHRLQTEPPPAAVIEAVSRHELEPTGEREFSIVESESGSPPRALVSPDLDCCEDCRREIQDPRNRRYRYAFTNCTNCGPRFTIIESLPYDRPATTMARFAMCAACRAEYQNPADRRFHAQPNACPECGPRLEGSLQEVSRALREGKIVAVKGIGGYHLACNAFDEAPLRRLRQAKGRMMKPFAVMVCDLETARDLAVVSPGEAALLASCPKPIVLLTDKGILPREVAPEVRTLGLMLPHTPLHHLLLAESDLRALVMTSANPSGLPIVCGREEAERELSGLADELLHHDRPIRISCDDSVVRLFRGKTLPVRRSRGYAPFPVELPFAVPPALAVGAQMKSTFCLARDREAFLSQHLGDLENLETLRFFERALDHLKTLYQLSPTILCADTHPGYLSTRWAGESALPLYRVQHHHAHLASCMAENGVPLGERVLGVIFDGTGYGQDGTVWGGELLEGDYLDFERKAWLTPAPLQGGDAAVREPWRMALGHLWAAGIDWDPTLAPVRAAPGGGLHTLQRQFERGLNTVATSSVGRLFDAVASVLGLHQRVEYEAQAAMALEGIAHPGEQGRYQFGLPLDPAPVWRQIVSDLRSGVEVGRIAMRFHRGLADAVVALCRAHDRGLRVALSGGVFQNVLLLELTVEGLERAGFRVLTHRLVPPNDGGLALGQLVVGAARHTREGSPSCA